MSQDYQFWYQKYPGCVSTWLQFEAKRQFMKLWLCYYVFNVNFEKISHPIVDFAHKKIVLVFAHLKVTRLFSKLQKYFSQKSEFPVLSITRDSWSVVQICMSFTHHLIPITRCSKLRHKKKRFQCALVLSLLSRHVCTWIEMI